MPGGDRTGPRGKGPKTGRGLGFCTDNNSPGYTNPQGRPFGGRGRGRRFFREEQITTFSYFFYDY